MAINHNTYVLLLVLCVVAATVVVSSSIVKEQTGGSFKINNIPYHRQINDYNCGGASLEMVLHHYGPDVDQRTGIDIARTTSATGTNPIDIVRAAHYSHISTPPPMGAHGYPFPSYLPAHGSGISPHRDYGYAAFVQHQLVPGACWASELALITKGLNTPAILLMHYAREDLGGHYRVFFGHNEDTDTFLLLDPWDRSNLDRGVISAQPLQPRVVSYSREDFCFLWNYADHSSLFNTSYGNYTAVIISPWHLDLKFYINEKGNVTVECRIEYPGPFNALAGHEKEQYYLAKNVIVNIELPKGLRSLTANPTFPSMAPGEVKTVKWDVYAENEMDTGVVYPSWIKVKAYGTISGYIRARQGWLPNTVYPAYDYSDQIGGEAQVWF
eukprot:TRINITY_DN4614_c0_g1_i1.p1 TRINITY_DN4614_c0_g1~~TRINITY_DN4614_c0_g1_i1.p1  ORF type:complete len:384 (-),score=70.36 TRINITY_DN4614_c0_g1_i1:36-1187(-)